MNRSFKYLAGHVILLVLSLVGIGIASYLTLVHYANVPLACSNQGLVDCARVLSSQYSVVPGTTVPITIPGLGWSLVMLALTIAGLRSTYYQRRVRLLELVWAGVGILTVLYLVYVELVRLHTICIWCTALHVTILIMLLTAIVQFQQPDSESEVEAEMEEEAQSLTPTRDVTTF
jgi:uncharacterized membrane protein